MSLLTEVPHYRIETDRPRCEITRLFTLALRWWPEIRIPEDMISQASIRKGEAPSHMGAAALRSLADGGTISDRQLDAAVQYLFAAIAFYRSASEPYHGRNVEAIRDLQDLLSEVLAP